MCVDGEDEAPGTCAGTPLLPARTPHCVPRLSPEGSIPRAWAVSARGCSVSQSGRRRSRRQETAHTLPCGREGMEATFFSAGGRFRSTGLLLMSGERERDCVGSRRPLLFCFLSLCCVCVCSVLSSCLRVVCSTCVLSRRKQKKSQKRPTTPFLHASSFFFVPFPPHAHPLPCTRAQTSKKKKSRTQNKKRHT